LHIFINNKKVTIKLKEMKKAYTYYQPKTQGGKTPNGQGMSYSEEEI
jgi:hypothetical protein